MKLLEQLSQENVVPVIILGFASVALGLLGAGLLYLSWPAPRGRGDPGSAMVILWVGVFVAYLIRETRGRSKD